MMVLAKLEKNREQCESKDFEKSLQMHSKEMERIDRSIQRLRQVFVIVKTNLELL